MKKGVEARRELINRAGELFDGRGYEAVSVKDIADSLGWAKSLFYYYCPSKEELVRLAAQARAQVLLDNIHAQLDAAQCGSVEKLGMALGWAGFWAGGDAQTSAERLKVLYSAASLPWRAYLRANITPQLGRICNDIIAGGVKEYEMFTPYSGTMGEVAVELTADLSEKLAATVIAGGDDMLIRAGQLLDAYRCAVERLMEAPFDSLRLVELDFIRDTAQALNKDAFASGGVNDDETQYDVGGAADNAADTAGGAGTGATDDE